jgi:NhaP-type Na+/H+ or K+/H+ antiporter
LVGNSLLFLVLVLAWVLVSGRLSARSVTGPLVLMTAGFLVAIAGPRIDINLDSETVRELIEITLALVLFSDASSIGLDWFRTEWRYPLRLLGIGLPVTVGLGILAAVILLPGSDIWLLGVVAAALAPTDAALGASIIEDHRIPEEFRQVINVESGLNDGLATPIVSFFIAMAAAHGLGEGATPLVSAVLSVLLGVGIGLAVGSATGRLVGRAGRDGWAVPRLLPIAPLVIAVATYFGTVAVSGNGFVAAFVCGVAFGGAVRPYEQRSVFVLSEQVGLLLGFAVWFVFGAGVLARTVGNLTWQMALYAVLSLTVLRMLPVALAAVGLSLSWDTVALAGWLGPRGLASIVFAILAFDEIGGGPGAEVLTVVAATVALSVVLHGLTAGPLAGWYSRRHPVSPLQTGAPEPSAEV